MSETTKFLLREEQIPTHWVNMPPTCRASRLPRSARAPASPPAPTT